MKKVRLPEPGDNTPRVLIGDVKKQLSRIPEGSIHCIVTSPPYWQQRDYEKKGQIGIEENAEDYVNEIAVEVGNKLKDVLDENGSYFLNIGDKYWDKDLQMIPSKVAIKMQENGWVLRNFINWYKPNHMPSSVEDRFTRTWEPIFFFVKGTGKYTTPDYDFFIDRVKEPHRSPVEEKYPPEEILNEEDYEALPDRIRKSESLPRFITEEEYKQLPECLRQEGNTDYRGKFEEANRKNLGASPGARISVQGFYYSGPHRKYDPDELEVIKYLRRWKEKRDLNLSEISEKTGITKTTIEHWFRTDKGGRCLPDPDSWLKLKEVLQFDDRYDKEMTETHYKLQGVMRDSKGKNPGDTWISNQSILIHKPPVDLASKVPEDKWHMNTGTLSDAHFSIFPKELVERVINSACPEDGIILDPFAGSGTVGEVAKELGRRSILIDLKEDYVEIMERRCGEVKVV